MKKHAAILLFTFLTISLFSQSPDLMTYQMVVRDNAGNIVAGSNVGLRLSILQGSAAGAEVFAETHSAATNTNGLLSVLIGNGINVSGSIAAINWAAGPFFLRAQTDPTGGTNYSIENISQLVSVPYSYFSTEAQSAQSAGNGFSHVSEIGDTLYFLNGGYVIIPGISAANGGGNNDVPGCTNNNACNYNSSATQDDGSCYYVGDACDDNNPATTDTVATDCNCVGFIPEGFAYELGDGVTDVDGNSYSTIKVEGIEWMVEDLRAVCFSNGDSITHVPSLQDWQAASDSAEAAWAWYNNDAGTGATYGRLYNGYAVKDERNVCPTGWHVPTSAEWKSFVMATGDTVDGVNFFGVGIESATAGIEMKDPLYWSLDDASNAAGFSGRPGGRRDDAGAFWEQNEKGFWWCIDGDTVDTSTLGARKLLQGSDSLYRFDANKGWGMNIRCREDTEITTGAAHSCGAANVHNPNLTYGSMTDQEGNTYKTIVIGTQEWMAENLNTSIYRNGDAIPTGLSNTEWENTINTQQGGWAYYNNDSSYACPYGKLYNWYACVDARALCPTGWHVPSDGEWNILVKNLDPNADTTCVNCGQSTLAGALMKSFGTIEGGSGYWVYFDLSVEGNNNSGFAGLPGGYRSINGDYYYMGYYGFWWSSTQYDSDFAWDRNLYYNNATVNRSNYDTQNGWGVRCLRD